MNDIGCPVRRVSFSATDADRSVDSASRSTIACSRVSSFGVLDHWDNLDGTVERGYAGQSLWDWHTLPDYLAPRYTRLRARERVDRHQRRGAHERQRERDSPDAGVSREGRGARRRVSSVRHSRVSHRALQRADRDRRAARPPTRSTRRCARGGRRRPTRSTSTIPDFGGFLVKANSEGQPGPAGLQAHARRRREHAGRRARAARRRRDVARVRLQQRQSPTTASSRRTTSSSRSTAQFRDNVLRAGEERAARLSAARAVPPAVRRDAEDAADDGVPDHEGIPRPGHAPRRISGRCSRRCSTPTRTRRARARRSRRSIDGSLHGIRAHRHRRRREHRHATATGRGSQFNQANWYAFGRLAWDPTLTSARDRRRVDAHDVHERPERSSRRSSAMMIDVARGGRELHDAARPRAHHGERPPLRAGPWVSRRRPRGLDAGLLPSRR